MSLPRRALPALLLLAAACGPKRRDAAPPAQILFRNESTEYTNVFVVRSGQSTRIGSVMSGQSTTLRVPTHLVSGDGVIEVVARTLAGRRQPRTGTFVLHEGQRVAVTLGAAATTLTVLPAQDP